MNAVDPNYQVLFDEARANYISGRFPDAAVTFEHLVQLTLKNHDIDNVVYFSYRAAGAWRKAGEEVKAMKVYKDLIMILGKHIIGKAKSYVSNSDNPKELAESLKLLLEISRVFQPSEIQSITTELVKTNFELAKEPDRRISEKKTLVETSIQLLRSINAPQDEINALLKFLADIYVQSGHQTLMDGGLDVEYVAAREYENAAKLYEELKEYKTADSLRKRAKELIEQSN